MTNKGHLQIRSETLQSTSIDCLLPGHRGGIECTIVKCLCGKAGLRWRPPTGWCIPFPQAQALPSLPFEPRAQQSISDLAKQVSAVRLSSCAPLPSTHFDRWPSAQPMQHNISISCPCRGARRELKYVSEVVRSSAAQRVAGRRLALPTAEAEAPRPQTFSLRTFLPPPECVSRNSPSPHCWQRTHLEVKGAAHHDTELLMMKHVDWDCSLSGLTK